MNYLHIRHISGKWRNNVIVRAYLQGLLSGKYALIGGKYQIQRQNMYYFVRSFFAALISSGSVCQISYSLIPGIPMDTVGFR